MSGQTPAAGWYLDGAGARRWWDGTSWTAHVSPQDNSPVGATARPHVHDTTSPRPAGETAGTGPSIVPGGIVRTPRTREGGKQILIGLGLLAVFALLTVGTQIAAAGGGNPGNARVFIGAAGAGAYFLLRGLSARYSSTPVVLLGFLGTAALVAVVMLVPFDRAGDSAVPTAAPSAAGAPTKAAAAPPAQATWRPDTRHDWISLGSTAAYWRADVDSVRCAAGTSCALAVVASRRACARLQLRIDLLDGAGVKRRATTLVLKDLRAGRGVSARITTNDELVEAYRITAARCL